MDALGEWARGDVIAVETYPAVALKDATVDAEVQRLGADVLRFEKSTRSDEWETDVRDAIACALVAATFRSRRGLLAAPVAGTSADEGGIWLPTGALPSRRPA